MDWTTKTFAGGQLATVMAQAMLDGEARETFLVQAGEPGRPDDSAREAFAALYGWRPPAELGEWEAVSKAYDESREAISGAWMLEDPISYLIESEKTFELENLFNARNLWVTALTGLESFGSDPSGDTCFVSTLQTGRDEGAEVHIFNHETGELDGGQFGSIANFIASCFSPCSSELEDEGEHPWSAAAAEFGEAFETSLTNRPAWGAADQLFARSQWLMDLPTGERGFELARKLGAAPRFEVWLEERRHLIEHPVLIHYWILAHYFLGNVEACREAIAIGRRSPGRLAPALAELIERLLEQPDTATFGELSAKALASLCSAVRKNAPPELLDPAVAAASAKAPSDEKAAVDLRAVEGRINAGEDPWAVIAEFSENVAVHDLVLGAIAASKKNKEFASRVKQYFSERTSAASNTWPYDPAKYDRRFNPVIAAAFRSGLRYDADHPKAYAGITKTLGIADDDLAMGAFEQAIDGLSVEDDRVPYVIESLAGSAHPRSGELLERGALRFFATLDDAKARNEERAKEGPTLDNIFSVDSHYAEALRVALRRDDDIAVRLAEKTLSFRSNLGLFGTELGLAVRVLTRRGQAGCLDWVEGYTGTTVERLSDSDWIDDVTQANLAECAIAIARLADREKAKAFLQDGFVPKRKRPEADLAIRGALLAGLLILEPESCEYRNWLERLLGSRTGAFAVFSVLRGIEESRVDVPAAWILPHVYAGRTSLTESQTGEAVVQAAARRALAAIGAPPPAPFEDGDEFALRVPEDELGAALLRPHRHRLASVFERIRKKKVTHPDIVTNGGAVLRDLYAWSADDVSRSNNNARMEGLRALRLQGPAAVTALAALLELPHMSLQDRGWARIALRYCGQEAAVRRWLQSAQNEEVLGELSRPTASSIAFPDLLAAHVVARIGEEAKDACLLALERRLADAMRTSDASAPGDPALTLLPRVVGTLGSDAQSRLRSLAEGFDSYRSTRAILERAAKFRAEPLTHNWNEPLVVETGCVGDESVRYRVRLSLAENKLSWRSTIDGFTLFQMLEASQSAGGTLEFASPDAARAFADLELQSLSLRGFRVG